MLEGASGHGKSDLGKVESPGQGFRSQRHCCSLAPGVEDLNGSTRIRAQLSDRGL